MSITLDEMKLYLRVDDTDEDSLIGNLIEFAKEEIKNSTGFDFESSDGSFGKTYNLAIMVIVTDRYENRSSSDQEFIPNNILSSIYTKLKLEVEDE